MLNCNFILSGLFSYFIYDLLLLAFLVIVVLLVVKLTQNSGLRNVGILLISLGGLGNIFYREILAKGCVFDPFSFFGLFHFNAFDVLLLFGVAVLIYCLYTQKHAKS